MIGTRWPRQLGQTIPTKRDKSTISGIKEVFDEKISAIETFT